MDLRAAVERYTRISRKEAIASCGAGEARNLCGDHIVEVAGRQAAFIVLEQGSRFETRETLRWLFTPLLLEQLKAGVDLLRTISLFVRPPDDLAWTFIDDAARVTSYGTTGDEWHATFHVSAPIPPALVARLGSPPPPPPSPLVGERLVAAIDSTTHPLALARTFYDGWFAPGGEQITIPSQPRIGTPRAVRDWHQLWDEIDRQHRCAVACQPKTWQPDGAMWLLQSETQSVVRWLVRDEDVHLDDPPVFIELEDGEIECASPSVSSFGLHLVVLFTALSGGTGVQGWTSVDRPHLANIQSIARRLPLPTWPWPARPTDLWTTEDGLIAVCDDEVHVQAPDDLRFEHMAAALGLDTRDLDTSYF